MGLVNVTGEAPFIEYQWYDVTNATYIGVSGFEFGDGETDKEGSSAMADLDPSLGATVELRVVNVSEVADSEDAGKASALTSSAVILRTE